MVAAAEVILFGIQAGVRLYGQSRQAYIEKTRQRDFTLPLPGLDHASTATQARAFFEQNAAGRHFVAAHEAFRRLHQKAMAGIQQFELQDPEGAQDYVERYDILRLADAGLTSEDGLQINDIVALNTIAQWRRGEEPHPSAVRRIAGTLTEIGIDYFTQGPGAGRLAGNSPTKLLLTAVLGALDDHDFIQEGLESAVEKVFIATLDVIGEQPQIVTHDPRLKAFFAGTAKGVLQDVQKRLQALPEDQRLFAVDDLSDVARAVFRSIVRNGAEQVVANPETLLGVAPGGEAELSATLGRILIEAVLPEGADGFQIQALTSAQTLDSLAKGALRIITEHPDLLRVDDPAVRKILLNVTANLAKETRKLGPDLFPDIARLVLEQTAENLDLLWKPDGAGENLAVKAAATLLGELARPPQTGDWRPQLSKSQLLNVVESMLDDLAGNPALLTRAIADQPALQAAVKAVLDALAQQELDNFSADTAARIVVLAVQAAADRWEFLEKLPGDTGQVMAVAKVVQTVLATIAQAGEKSAWKLAQDYVLVTLMETAFDKLAEYGVNETTLQALQATLDASVASLEAGAHFSLEGFADQLAQKLAA